MRILLTTKEFESLFEAIDLDRSGTVEFDEFSKLWESVEERQSGSGRRTSGRAMSALAERAIQKIAKGPIEDPRKYLRAFSGMPSNFRPSVLAKLDNDEMHSITHMLSGAKDELMSQQVLKSHNTKKKKLSSKIYESKVTNRLPLSLSSWTRRPGSPFQQKKTGIAFKIDGSAFV